jgi:hypothetical protein
MLIGFADCLDCHSARLQMCSLFVPKSTGVNRWRTLSAPLKMQLAGTSNMAPSGFSLLVYLLVYRPNHIERTGNKTGAYAKLTAPPLGTSNNSRLRNWPVSALAARQQ